MTLQDAVDRAAAYFNPFQPNADEWDHWPYANVSSLEDDVADAPDLVHYVGGLDQCTD